MILIPEIETVVILVPRTGSGSLRRAIADAYPKSMMLYRHMEADGIPHGYDRWAKIGIVREPVDRLWSLYKFLLTLKDRTHHADHAAAMHASVSKEVFSSWIVNNQTVFTTPHGSSQPGYTPVYTTRHQLPETRKSQFVYLRPDLGTEVYSFTDMNRVAERLKLPRAPDTHVHRTAATPPPTLTTEAREHIRTWFAWDTEINNQLMDTSCRSAAI